jgi:hypothetical protein
MLDSALEYNLSEAEFWNMTIGEYDRFIKSKQRQDKNRAKEKAIFDYSLAVLIGRAFGASEENPFPDLYEAYPSVFADEIEEHQRALQEQHDKLSALRFIQFAESFNQKLKEEAT